MHNSVLIAYWKMVFCKTFGYRRWKSVRMFICGLGHLDFKHIQVLRCFKLWKSLHISSNGVL